MKSSRPQSGRKKEYTMREVSLHCTADDGWTVIENKVYNLSGFCHAHPGGFENIYRAVGKDGTDFFSKNIKIIINLTIE